MPSKPSATRSKHFASSSVRIATGVNANEVMIHISSNFTTKYSKLTHNWHDLSKSTLLSIIQYHLIIIFRKFCKFNVRHWMRISTYGNMASVQTKHEFSVTIFENYLTDKLETTWKGIYFHSPKIVFASGRMICLRISTRMMIQEWKDKSWSDPHQTYCEMLSATRKVPVRTKC